MPHSFTAGLGLTLVVALGSAGAAAAAADTGAQDAPPQAQSPAHSDTQRATVTDTATTARVKEHNASDDWITTKIKGQLLADRSVARGSDINVQTSGGVVSLTGTASSRKAATHARDIARNVKGVRSVDTTGLRLASAR